AALAAQKSGLLFSKAPFSYNGMILSSNGCNLSFTSDCGIAITTWYNALYDPFSNTSAKNFNSGIDARISCIDFSFLNPCSNQNSSLIATINSGLWLASL